MISSNPCLAVTGGGRGVGAAALPRGNRKYFEEVGSTPRKHFRDAWSSFLLAGPTPCTSNPKPQPPTTSTLIQETPNTKHPTPDPKEETPKHKPPTPNPKQETPHSKTESATKFETQNCPPSFSAQLLAAKCFRLLGVSSVRMGSPGVEPLVCLLRDPSTPRLELTCFPGTCSGKGTAYRPTPLPTVEP